MNGIKNTMGQRLVSSTWQKDLFLFLGLSLLVRRAKLCE